MKIQKSGLSSVEWWGLGLIRAEWADRNDADVLGSTYLFQAKPGNSDAAAQVNYSELELWTQSHSAELLKRSL